MIFIFVAGAGGAKPWQKGANSNNKFSKGKGQPGLGASKFSKFGTDRKPIKQEKDGQQTSTEKVDWNKFKKEKKDLKMQRKGKGNKDLFELISQAKKIYELLKW